MVEDITTLKLFYPILFFVIGVIITVLIFSCKTVLIKFKEKDSEDFRFKTHVDEHIDTTGKFSKAHTEIIAGLPIEYHQELHCLEEKVKNVESQLILLTVDINKKLDLMIERISKLENK